MVSTGYLRLSGEAQSGEVEAFHGLERRRVLQAAYERNYRQKVLDAHAIRNRLPVERPRPLFQVITCDDREESFRRHIEEVEPRAETFGAAGS
ncbi:MAG: putative inorganic carbon transporter subunit DabA [Pirellulaceae bacterium]